MANLNSDLQMYRTAMPGKKQNVFTALQDKTKVKQEKPVKMNLSVERLTKPAPQMGLSVERLTKPAPKTKNVFDQLDSKSKQKSKATKILGW